MNGPRAATANPPSQEVESTTESLTALIEPIMIAVLGGIVGSMIIALYMPIFKIFDLIG